MLTRRALGKSVKDPLVEIVDRALSVCPFRAYGAACFVHSGCGGQRRACLDVSSMGEAL